MSDSRKDVYPVTPDWRKQVSTELDGRGRGSRQALCKALGISSARLTELLQDRENDGPRYSALVPLVQRYLGWDMPSAPFPGSREMGTIRYLVERANDSQRRYLLDAANMLLRAPEAHATQALQSMLLAFRTAFDPLRDLGAVAKILVIESDAAHRKAMEQSSRGTDKIDLIITDNAMDGLLLAGAARPNLVVIDANLDALSVCRHIKANPSTNAIDVAIAADVVTPKLANAARSAGAWRVLAKPLDLVFVLGDLTSHA